MRLRDQRMRTVYRRAGGADIADDGKGHGKRDERDGKSAAATVSVFVRRDLRKSHS
jgi:hypothetical protein